MGPEGSWIGLFLRSGSEVTFIDISIYASIVTWAVLKEITYLGASLARGDELSLEIHSDNGCYMWYRSIERVVLRGLDYWPGIAN